MPARVLLFLTCGAGYVLFLLGVTDLVASSLVVVGSVLLLSAATVLSVLAHWPRTPRPLPGPAGSTGPGSRAIGPRSVPEQLPHSCLHRSLDAGFADFVSRGGANGLAVLLAEPFSGASRLLIEILGRCRHTVVLVTPPPAWVPTASPDVLRQPLPAMANSAAQLRADGRRDPIIVVIDDLALHVGRGLDLAVLDRFRAAGAVVVATIRTTEMQALQTWDAQLARAVTDAAFGQVLSATLDEEELAQVSEAHGDAALAGERRLVEHLAASEALRDRYLGGFADQELGVAYVDAARLWHRAGMPPAMPIPLLDRLASAVYAADKGLVLDPEERYRALTWALAPVGMSGSLLEASSEHADHFRSHRALEVFDLKLSPEQWVQAMSLVIGAAGPLDAVALALALADQDPIASVAPTQLAVPQPAANTGTAPDRAPIANSELYQLVASVLAPGPG